MIEWKVEYFAPDRASGVVSYISRGMKWTELPKDGVLFVSFSRDDLYPPYGVTGMRYTQRLSGYDYYWYDGAFTFGGWNDELEAWGGIGRELKWLASGAFHQFVYKEKPNKPESQIIRGVMVPPPWDEKLGFVSKGRPKSVCKGCA